MPGKPPLKPGDPPIRAIDYTVNGDGCWVWNWAVHPKGYASVKINGRTYKAHRLAYELAKGPIPDGQIIRHLCGNPSCLNPEHLLAGTQTENSRDMVEAGNQVHQKLMPSDAIEIRRIFAEGDISRAEIARQYGVTSGAIRMIIANITFYDANYTPPPKEKAKKGEKPIGQDIAKEIRRIYQGGGKSQKEIGLMFNIDQSVVGRIIRNRLYPDSNYDPPIARAWNQKLTKSQADEIREKSESGITYAKLAGEYGVSAGLIRKIVVGEIHRDKPRKRSKRTTESREAQPTLRSINGPAPTSLAEQKRRQLDTNKLGRKPLRKPGEPAITENDWVLNAGTGCHEWRWGKMKTGHGLLSYGKEELAHRVAWIIQNGPIPKGYQINHRCNNAPCINTEHLYLGDQLANMRDIAKAGYSRRRRLTLEQAKAIRAKYEPGKITYKKLANEYNVDVGTIMYIIKNETYIDPDYTPKNPGIGAKRKLSMSDANAIREKYQSERVTLSTLAREFGSHQSIIGRIVRNETYHDPNYTPPSPEEMRLWKLSNVDKEAIISESRSGIVTRKQLAKKFGVGVSQITKVIQGGDGPVDSPSV